MACVQGQVIDPWQLSDFLLIEAGAYSSFIEDADAGSEAEVSRYP